MSLSKRNVGITTIVYIFKACELILWLVLKLEAYNFITHCQIKSSQNEKKMNFKEFFYIFRENIQDNFFPGE